MIPCGYLFAVIFGVKIFFIYEGLILFVVLKMSVAEVRNLLISIVVVPFFSIQLQ